MKVPISSAFLDALALGAADADNRCGQSRRDRARSDAPRTNERARARADDKVTLDSLIFLLCCSNRVAVPCDSRGHKFEVAIYHGQEDSMAKRATKAKSKPAAKKTTAKKSTAKRKTTTRKK